MSIADQTPPQSPLVPFLYSAAITVALFVGGGWVFATRYTDLLETETKAMRLEHIEGTILWLDETLSMSARMATVTGEPRWEQRFHQYEQQLATAIHEALEIAPSEAQGATHVMDDVNQALTLKEHSAFALVRQGKLAEAAAVFDAAYDEQEQLRARDTADFVRDVYKAVDDRLEAHRQSRIATVLASAVALVLLALLWWRMLATIRRYIRERREAMDQLRRAHATLEIRVEERTREVAAGREQYRGLVENIDAIPFEWDPAERAMIYIAPKAATLFGCSIEELHGPAFLAKVLHPGDRERLTVQIEQFLAGERSGTLDCAIVTAAHRTVYVRILAGSRTTSNTSCGVIVDVTQQKQLESELQQAQKLESIGRLASGIAHEINTPVQFVTDSVQFLRDGMTDLLNVIDKHHRSTECVLVGQPSTGLAHEARAAETDADMPYLSVQGPKALERALDGLSRVASIVRSLKVFAHPRTECSAIDLNESISNTLTIARGEYKYVAVLDTDFGDLPLVTCYAGELNQVILNLVINAAHAIGDAVAGTEQLGRITVATRHDGDDVVISVADTGPGIPEAIRERVFEPFFTTKDVGKGTGQGLSHAKKVVVEHHHGRLTFDTTIGAGTTFHIRIPICGIAQHPVIAYQSTVSSERSQLLH